MPVITFIACTYSCANIVDIQGICWLFNQAMIQHNCEVLIMTCGGTMWLKEKMVEEMQIGIKIRLAVVCLIKSNASIGALD